MTRWPRWAKPGAAGLPDFYSRLPQPRRPEAQVVVLPQRGAPGVQGEAGCVVCAIPFIRPRDVLQSQAGQSADDKQHALQLAIQGHYQDVFDAASARRAALELALGASCP